MIRRRGALLVDLREQVHRRGVRRRRAEHHAVGIRRERRRRDVRPGRPVVRRAKDAVRVEAAPVAAERGVDGAVGGDDDVRGRAEGRLRPAQHLLPGTSAVSRTQDPAVGGRKEGAVLRMDGEGPDDVEEVIEGDGIVLRPEEPADRDLRPRQPAVGGLEQPLAEVRPLDAARRAAQQLPGAVVPDVAGVGVLHEGRHARVGVQRRSHRPRLAAVGGEVDAAGDAAGKDAPVGGAVVVQVHRQRPRPAAHVDGAAEGPRRRRPALGRRQRGPVRQVPRPGQLARADVRRDAAGPGIRQAAVLVGHALDGLTLPVELRRRDAAGGRRLQHGPRGRRRRGPARLAHEPDPEGNEQGRQKAAPEQGKTDVAHDR